MAGLVPVEEVSEPFSQGITEVASQLRLQPQARRRLSRMIWILRSGRGIGIPERQLGSRLYEKSGFNRPSELKPL